MGKEKSKLQEIQKETQTAINKVNEQIEVLGDCTSEIFKSLNDIQNLFDQIRSIPSDQKLKYSELKKIRMIWKQQAENIEDDYQKATVKGVGAGAAGAGLGVAAAALGPTVAMGVATTFGVASTGTAISTLHGIVATNAALAWLGGGALSIGGGGMVAGEALLSLAGPVGWAIAGLALLSSGVFFWKAKKNKETIEEIFILIGKRDIASYKLAVVELKERIKRIRDENVKLKEAISIIYSFGLDYSRMSEKQQYQLGSYLNLMESSTQLMTNPILGLQPKYTENDFEIFRLYNETNDMFSYSAYRNAAVSLANFLYKIDMDAAERKLMWKTIRNNKEMLKAFNISRKNFELYIIETVNDALNYKYNH